MFNGSVFLVNDLNAFISNIKENNYTISGGPKSDRAEINSLSSFIVQKDKQYRDSLYKHNVYHTTVDSNLRDFRFSRDKFSYKNIHKNIQYSWKKVSINMLK